MLDIIIVTYIAYLLIAVVVASRVAASFDHSQWRVALGLALLWPLVPVVLFVAWLIGWSWRTGLYPACTSTKTWDDDPDYIAICRRKRWHSGVHTNWDHRWETAAAQPKETP